MDEPWRILEFYSGIGGMRYSLMRAGIRCEVLEAFDINDTANDVYELNFGHRPFQGNIQTLTATKLDKYGAHAWLLSPPCQPYTRQGLQKHSADARAFSFVKILELIPHMLHPPLMLFVENVVGFEISDTHNQMIKILAKIGFVTQEYILSPLQFGIPYSRPRYFCLAKRKPLSFQNPSLDNQLLWAPSPFLLANSILKDSLHCLDERQEECTISCEPIRNFLEQQVVRDHQLEHSKSDFCHESDASTLHREDDIDNISRSRASQNAENIFISTEEFGREVEGIGLKNTSLKTYTVPLSLIERWGSAMDIVDPNSKRCCCFTKSYYRYVKGTGSLLATSEITNSVPTKKSGDSSLKDLGLRYFTPREVANLHSFPEEFHFPLHISLRQQYALLGNSLSIAVVAPLLQCLFTEPTQIARAPAHRRG